MPEPPALAGPPPGDVDVPGAVWALADGRTPRPVWRNQLGGLTFELRGETDRCFVKWAPARSGLDLAAEAARLRWAAPFTPVPHVLDEGADDAGAWLLTDALPGDNAVIDRWKADPRTAVTAIAEGLAAMHDALPVDRCPFDWTAEARIADIEQRAAAGTLDPSVWHNEHRHLSIAEAIDVLADGPPDDRTVVCHGDACAPNTLLTDDGRWSGHVDLGALGVGDRWADLAIATWSCEWNYGPGWEATLLDVYGVATDADRTRYYRLLWDLGP